MAKRDPRVTKYIDKCAPFARPILKRVRQVVGSRLLVEKI